MLKGIRPLLNRPFALTIKQKPDRDSPVGDSRPARSRKADGQPLLSGEQVESAGLLRSCRVGALWNIDGAHLIAIDDFVFPQLKPVASVGDRLRHEEIEHVVYRGIEAGSNGWGRIWHKDGVG